MLQLPRVSLPRASFWWKAARVAFRSFLSVFSLTSSTGVGDSGCALVGCTKVSGVLEGHVRKMRRLIKETRDNATHAKRAGSAR